jgi:hypothetical protein
MVAHVRSIVPVAAGTGRAFSTTQH